jgi:hypothetical protein
MNVVGCHIATVSIFNLSAIKVRKKQESASSANRSFAELTKH